MVRLNKVGDFLGTISPLRYPGGKAKLYSFVKELLNANSLIGETYMEPFAGGCGLALKLLINDDVKKIIINDIDFCVYSFWYCVLNHSDELIELIDQVNVNIDSWKEAKRIYSTPNEHKIIEVGFSTFFLNRTNVSGVIKGGIIGGLEQHGNYKIDARFNKSDLIHRIRLINSYKDKIILLNKDARELLRPDFLRKYYKLFINVDPPYVKKGSQLYENSFSTSDHLDIYKLLSECKRKWIVTYDNCDFIEKLYEKYPHDIIDINYSLKNNRKASELIFYNKNVIH